MRVRVSPSAPVFRRVVECIHASLRNSWARARAGASPVPPTIFLPPETTRGRRIYFKAVRSELLRLLRAWLSVRVRFSPSFYGEVAQLVEHVIVSGRCSPGFLFWAVKVKLLRSNPNPRAWREPWLQIRAPVVYVSKRGEGLQGNFACVSPRIYFGGSENAVTPVRAAPFRWSRSLVRYQPVPSREP